VKRLLLLALLLLLVSGCTITPTIVLDWEYRPHTPYRVTDYYFSSRGDLVIDGYFTESRYVDELTFVVDGRTHRHFVGRHVRRDESYRVVLRVPRTRTSGRITVTIR